MAEARKERPILMSGPMVRAILQGRKSETRRVVKWPDFVPSATDAAKADLLGRLVRTQDRCITVCGKDFGCPYGKPGDALWVKETFGARILHSCAEACDCADVSVRYAADGQGKTFGDWRISSDWMIPKAARDGGLLSSLFMPRWASRLLLLITDIRAERLHDITEEGAKAEGVISNADGTFSPFADGPKLSTARLAYAYLWNKINQDRGKGWATNPWVFVVQFSVEATGGAK